MEEKTFTVPTKEELEKFRFDNPCIYMIENELRHRLNTLVDVMTAERQILFERIEKLEGKR